MLSEESLDLFSAALGPERASEISRAALRAAVSALVTSARAELPELTAGDAFLQHAARHLRGGGDSLVEAIAAVHAGDLLLASVCATGEVQAIAVFLRRYEEDVLRAARRLRAAGVDPQDLSQELARRAFSGPSPKIAEYSGRGELRAWVRIVATRLALDVARLKRNGERATDVSAFEGIANASEAPDLAYFRRLYQAEVRAALEAAAQTLSAEDRAALRDHHVLGLSIDDIAAAQGIHRATAARRVQRAREALVDNVRRILDERHGLAGRDLISVMNLVRSQMNITMGRLLG